MTRRDGRPRRLAVVPPGQDDGSRAEMARALLERTAPLEGAVTDAVGGLGGMDLHSDPRYLIGRLAQALSGLLSAEVPEMNGAEWLIVQAIADATAYREQLAWSCTRHDDGSECGSCRPHLDRAYAYDTLYGQLGLVGRKEQPARPRLTVVPE